MKIRPIVLPFAAFCLLASGTFAQQSATALSVAKTFGDHMVFQQGMETSVWGNAAPGAEVTVAFAGQTLETKANGEGEWKVALKPLKTSKKGSVLKVSSGDQSLSVQDVLVGEVWMCSGQSNMGFTLKGAEGGNEEAAQANFPLLRLFSTPTTTAMTPQRDVKGGSWKVCSPESAPSFSAVGYYFGKELVTKLDTPIGMVNTAWGGKPSEAFTSLEKLDATPSAKRLLEEWRGKQSNYDPEADKANYEKLLAAYEAKKKAYAEARKNKQQGTPPGRPPAAPSEPMAMPNAPAAIYHQMIAPWTPFAIKGAIWYQGESNRNRAKQYETIFPAMIEDWRDKWGNHSMPFYFVQLANFLQPTQAPGMASSWAELQNAQTLTLDKLPHTGMAIINEIGAANDIHPKNKKDVGHRLALWALNKDYGQDVGPISGPIMICSEVAGSGIRVVFGHVGKGLKSRDGGELKRFEVAGEDQKWAWADAKVEKGGKSVLLSSKEVPQPVAARYAWAANPEGANLVNSAGLPASLFRTDDWPLATEGYETLGDGAVPTAASLALQKERLEKAGYKVLFNGYNLDGWKNPYDWGKVTVRNGEILLEAEKKFFLVTEATYSDFLLNVEIKIPEGKANSGVMFRAHVEPNKVYGYQAECDGSDRCWSGGLYDEGRRGWVWPSKEGRTEDPKMLAYAKESQEFMQQPKIAGALKRNDWNSYQISCRGNRINIKLNGVTITNLQDDTDACGHIGIQHHGEKGAVYKFRNIFLKEY
jgi:sialate O-acetylesterase